MLGRLIITKKMLDFYVWVNFILKVVFRSIKVMWSRNFSCKILMRALILRNMYHMFLTIPLHVSPVAI